MSNTAKKLETVTPTATTPNTALTVVKGADKTADKKADKKPLTFDERRKQADLLYTLFERHEKLKDHGNELLAIVRADDSVSTNFKLVSSNGHSWQTSNQEFIKKTVKVMHDAILTKIAEVETEIELIQIG